MAMTTTNTLTAPCDRLLTELVPEPWQLRVSRSEPEVPAEQFERMGTPIQIQLAKPLRLGWFRNPVGSMMRLVGSASV